MSQASASDLTYTNTGGFIDTNTHTHTHTHVTIRCSTPNIVAERIGWRDEGSSKQGLARESTRVDVEYEIIDPSVAWQK